MYRFKHLFLLTAVIAVLTVFTNKMYCDGNLIGGFGSGSDVSGIDAAVEIFIKNTGAGITYGAGMSPSSEQNQSPAPSQPAKPAAPKHEHSYTAETTKEATCAEEGVITYTCSCGKSYAESIPMVDHQYESAVTKEPGCTEEGVTTFTCSVCGDAYEEPIKAKGHSEGEWETTAEPTCTETGEKVILCRDCGEQLQSETLEALGHTESAWIVDVQNTWFKEGSQHKECTVCGEQLSQEVIPSQYPLWYMYAGIGAGTAVLVVLIIVIAVAVSKKSKKDVLANAAESKKKLKAMSGPAR